MQVQWLGARPGIRDLTGSNLGDALRIETALAPLVLRKSRFEALETHDLKCVTMHDYRPSHGEERARVVLCGSAMEIWGIRI